MFDFVFIIWLLFLSIYVKSHHTLWAKTHISGCGRSKKNNFIFFERLAMIEDKQPFRNIIVIMESYIQFFYKFVCRKCPILWLKMPAPSWPGYFRTGIFKCHRLINSPLTLQELLPLSPHTESQKRRVIHKCSRVFLGIQIFPVFAVLNHWILM